MEALRYHVNKKSVFNKHDSVEWFRLADNRLNYLISQVSM